MFFKRFENKPSTQSKFLIITICLTLAACWHSDSNSNASSTSRSQTIGASGGEIVSSDGLLRLEIPAGALEQTVEIRIDALRVSDVPDALSSESNLSYYELGPDGLTFDAPIKVVLEAPINPVARRGEFSLPILALGTVDDEGVPEVLLDQTVIVREDAGSASVTVEGALSHFSPLILRRGSLNDVDFLVSGVPAQIEVDDPVNASFTAELRTGGGASRFLDRRVGVCPAFNPDNQSILETAAGDCFDTSTPPAFEMFQVEREDGTLGPAQQSVVLYCPGVGRTSLAFIAEGGVVYANTLFATDTSGDDLGRVYEYSFYSSTPVDCVDAGGEEPDSTPELGLFSAPSGLQLLETLQLVSEAGINALAPTTQVLGLLMAGDHGSALIRADNGNIIADQTSENKTGFNLQGAHLIAQLATSGERSTAAAIVEYGVGAQGFLMNFSPDTGEFGPGGNIRQGAHTDAANVPPGTIFANEMVVTADTEIRFVSYDSSFDGYSWSASLDYNFLEPVSATGKIDGGAILVVTETGDLYFDDRIGDKENVGSVGESPRKIRCSADGPVCAVSDFANDQVIPLVWDGVGTPVILEPLPVGDGPVGIDIWYDEDSGNSLLISAGFNDNTFHIIELDSEGGEVATSTHAVEEGCLAPGHPSIVGEYSDTEDVMVAVPCYQSSNYFIAVVPRTP